jgi:LIM domain/Protein DA1
MKPPDRLSVCQGCKKALSGRYIQALGTNWHPDCWRCEACGKPLPEAFVERGGRAYHPECHEERFGLRCGICKSIIHGAYFQHEGQAICKEDYLARFAPRCYFCDQVLLGTFKVNAYGQKACKRHEAGIRCTSCDRWLEPAEWRLPALTEFGTILCDHCQPGAVGVREAQAYGQTFGAAVLRELGLDLPTSVQAPIRIETTAELAALKGILDPDAYGLTLTRVETLNGVECTRMVSGIVVIGGLAREHFEGVLAHEFGHVWLFKERQDHHAKILVEGFCELIRYCWLSRSATPLATELQRKMADNPDPIYGDGFRLMKGIWDRAGIQAVVKRLAS